MKHLREDYNAIQPFPTKRPHHVRIEGETVLEVDADVRQLGKHMDPIIPDDEPVFLLRAKDMLAPDLVRMWASALMEVNELHAGSWEAMSDLAERVSEWADVMEEYARENYDGGYAPDTPAKFLKGD